MEGGTHEDERTEGVTIRECTNSYVLKREKRPTAAFCLVEVARAVWQKQDCRIRHVVTFRAA